MSFSELPGELKEQILIEYQRGVRFDEALRTRAVCSE